MRPSRSACSPRSRSCSSGRSAAFTLSIAATGLIYLSYFLCNLGLAFARSRGWPHQRGLVQPRSVGDADQHPRAAVGRDHDHQHRPVGEPGAVRRLRQQRPGVLEPADQRAVLGLRHEARWAAGMAAVRDDRRARCSSSGRSTTSSRSGAAPPTSSRASPPRRSSAEVPIERSADGGAAILAAPHASGRSHA